MDKKRFRYSILKEIDRERKDVNAELFGLDEKEFLAHISYLYREGYITKPMLASNIVYSMAGVSLTGKGEKYLDENSAFAKGYAAAKEIREWINALKP
ncbi:hypothetical protein IGI39_003340 [Enterococcus sp. AZ135]|uniref:YjcQ family protein n=1 Tax=unclassified Enterococcus TaxID=2608891 RepID=UPI003F290B8D